MGNRRRHPIRKRIYLVIGIIFLVIVGFIMFKLFHYAPVVYDLAFKKNITLKKDSNERVNILLLGIGGGTHDGPDLTDTIIFASLDPKTEQTTLLSIPRDLWIPELNGKINSAYAIAEEKKKGGGLLVTKALVQHILNQPVDYGIRIDFNGFVKAVDLVGGLDITVDRTFDDYEYPITGKEDDTCGASPEDLPRLATASSQLDAFPCRYEHLHFDQGLQHMDGETALKFVRSRHALGPEGTDFARSKRQEKVIAAFKDKVFSLGTFLNPIKLVNLYDTFKDSIDTDITQNDYADFIKLAQKMEKAKIHSYVLDFGDEETGRPGLLTNPIDNSTATYGYEWVLVPASGVGNYTGIQSYVTCILSRPNCSLTPTPSPSVSEVGK